MQLDYDPICDARPIAGDERAICEVSKYVCKASSLLTRLPATRLDPAIAALTSALDGRRLVTYTGAWRQARADLRIIDGSEDTLDDTLPARVCGHDAPLVDAMLRWDGCKYRG